MSWVTVGCLGAAGGLFVEHYQSEANDNESSKETNLFDRDQFIFFDWGVYANFVAVVSGIVSTILAAVALCVNQS